MQQLMPEFNRVRVTQVKDEEQRGSDRLNLTFDLPADISIIKRHGEQDDYQIINLIENSFDLQFESAFDKHDDGLLGDKLEKELRQTFNDFKLSQQTAMLQLPTV